MGDEVLGSSSGLSGSPSTSAGGKGPKTLTKTTCGGLGSTSDDGDDDDVDDVYEGDDEDDGGFHDDSDDCDDYDDDGGVLCSPADVFPAGPPGVRAGGTQSQGLQHQPPEAALEQAQPPGTCSEKALLDLFMFNLSLLFNQCLLNSSWSQYSLSG